MPMIKRRRKMDKNRRCLYGALKKSKLDQTDENTINPEQTSPLKTHKNEEITDVPKETIKLNDLAKESEVKCSFKSKEEPKLAEAIAKNDENSKEVVSKPSKKTKQR